MFFSKIYESWRGIQEEKYRDILRHIGPETTDRLFNGRVLDLGSGYGFLEAFLARNGRNLSDWVCLDPDIVMLGDCAPPKVLGDGNGLPFREECFSNIVCLDTIHLLKEDFSGVLETGGLALVSLFCNQMNMEERRDYLRKKLAAFDVIDEFVAGERETDVVVLARKR